MGTVRTAPVRAAALLTPALLVAVLAGCESAGPGEKDSTYDSLDALRQDAEAAGLTCAASTPLDTGSADVEAVECQDTTLLAVSASDVSDDEVVSMLPRAPASEEEGVLVGPNWVVLGDLDALEQVQAGIGGELTAGP